MLELVNHCHGRLLCVSMADATQTRTPAQEAWELLGKLFWESRPRLLRVATEFGLTPPQLFALRQLDPAEPVPMRALATALHCDSSNVTGLVDGLAAQGLVERREAEHDRRMRMLVVTEHGAEVRTRLLAVMREVPEPLAALSAEDQTALRDVLRRALG
jgi:DNA-binding MarR family transcriptional regulator